MTVPSPFHVSSISLARMRTCICAQSVDYLHYTGMHCALDICVMRHLLFRDDAPSGNPSGAKESVVIDKEHALWTYPRIEFPVSIMFISKQLTDRLGQR